MPKIYDNKYLHQKELGKGGFGRVFLAKEEVSNRLVAIKELLNKDSSQQESIIDEIQQVSKFHHSGIVTYYHHFKQDGLLYLVMEYCEKGSIDGINDKITLTSDFIIEYVKSVALSLHEVHQKGIIHHDIKPSNLLLTKANQIKISDFGITNSYGGTRAYMSPEVLNCDKTSICDERVDIYALGVTLLELLIGKNPFWYKSKDEIIELHSTKNFEIQDLPAWQQEIILKAINKYPELRFQTMKDFAEALALRQVPILLNRDIIRAGDIAEKAERYLHSKKWNEAFKALEFVQNNFPTSVNVLRVLGQYYLFQNKIELAKTTFEKALSINRRLDVQKELATINIQLKNHSVAISMISDYLHRNPSDFEAHNLLLQCYYETNRYEAGIELGKIILSANNNNPIIANNYYLCHILQNMPYGILPNTVLKERENPFVDYNIGVCFEDENKLSHHYDKSPTLKSKLLFADYRFLKLHKSELFLSEADIALDSCLLFIIKFGREGYSQNNIQVPGGNSVSRRHCVIINAKDDTWLYNLDSTGTYLNEEEVVNKAPIIGLNKLKISKTTYTITTDKSKLL